MESHTNVSLLNIYLANQGSVSPLENALFDEINRLNAVIKELVDRINYADRRMIILEKLLDAATK